MTATVTPLRPRQPPRQPHDPALLATLAELSQLGLAVARAASRLADVETAAADALAETAASTTSALADQPASLNDALRIGQNADSSEAARDAAIARVTAITACFDKAARSVRRTVALQARLAAGYSFPELPHIELPEPGLARPQPASRSRPANDADPAEHPDRPELGDELGARTDEEVLHAIRRDLSTAATNLARLTPDPRRVDFSPPTQAPAPAPAPLPDNQPRALRQRPPPAPDT